MGVKARLLLFIKSLNLKPSQFEKKCGLSNGYVRNIRKSIGEEALKRILSTYPHLNKLWLLHDVDGMLIGSEPNTGAEKELSDLKARVNQLEKQIHGNHKDEDPPNQLKKAE